MSELTCEVCNENPASGVYSVPGIPMSCAYCTECGNANAHPYHVVVANTALCDGLENSASWWQELVEDTLAHLGKSPEQFNRDVQACLTELNNFDPNG